MIDMVFPLRASKPSSTSQTLKDRFPGAVDSPSNRNTKKRANAVEITDRNHLRFMADTSGMAAERLGCNLDQPE